MSQGIKKILSLMICVVMWLSLISQAQLPTFAVNIPAEYDVPITRSPETPETVAQGTCGENITWSLISNGLLSLEGTGAMDDYASASATPWYSYRSTIKTVQIGDGITSIGDRAFYSCTLLCDVTVGADVATVGTYAFRGCTALISVTLPQSVTQLKGSAFRGCTNLTFVALEGNAPTVENYVFNDGASSRTLQYPEGSTGYDVSPWTEFTHSTVHVGTWITTVVPNCTTEGLRSIDCTYCKATFTDVLPVAHQYVNGICSVCDQIEILHSGRCGPNAWWELNAVGTLSITGSGRMFTYYSSSPAPWNQYWQDIQTVMIHSGVTSISDYAFYDCISLTSTTIPEGVTSIGTNTFSNCSSLTSISIPESVTSIGDSAFSNCSSLTSISIPESVTSIGDSAFSNCSSLTNITIPESVTSIGINTFSNCSSLTSISIPESVTSIGDSAFSNCSSLTNITIPESVTSIGWHVFESCSSLTSITIPEGVTSIGINTFSNCSSLTSISIPESVTSIGRSAFSGCSSLEEVHISNLVAWCHINFGGGTAANPVFYAKNLYLNNALLTNLIIPEEVTSIRNDTFSNCSSLTSISIPESVTRIGDYAFSDCSSLTSVTISEGVTSIGEGTFTSCSSLTSVTIPESVTSIGNNAFSWCSSLTSIKFMGSAPTFKSNTFSGVKATANHPCTDATWTDSVKANYGGSLTWKGHLFSDYVYNQDATCTENATHTGSCPDCGAIDTIPVPDTAFGHSYGEAVVTDPTCTEEGYTTYTCHCGDTYIDDRKASLGHDYIEGFCSHCGIKELWGSGQCGNDVYWELDVFGTLSISGSGSIPDYITDSVPWDQYREEIKTVMIQNGITSIGSHAFYNCSNLTSVTIPEGVTSIDGGAFWDCSSLTSVTIPESVTSIGSHAFCNCSNLTSVTIPESVISIGNDAFSNCSNLTSVTILEGVTSIGDGAFSSCSSLTGISIPEGVTSIGNYTFAFCSSLTSISIPEGVTSIGYDTFSNCSNLTSVIIPESVTSIGDYAFVDCGSLTSITIPEGVTSIGRYAFRGCSSLTSIQFMGNAPTLYSNCFYGVNATVYHPCTDATWTDSVKANYGGSLTWVGHRFENGACVNCGQPTGVTLRGTITSFDAVDGAVTVRLMQGEVEVSNVVSTNGTYCLEMVAAGEYTLVISKQNHVTRTYSLTVADQDVTQNVKIHLIGDIDGNGKVNVGDTTKVYSHVKKTALITDPYMLLCADIDGNGKINVGDTTKVYAHVKKTNLLW